jgi:hypothetical protein
VCRRDLAVRYLQNKEPPSQFIFNVPPNVQHLDLFTRGVRLTTEVMASEMHWQIAPEYQREAIAEDTSDSDSTISDEEAVSEERSNERDSGVPNGVDIEKTETATTEAATVPPTRPTTLQKGRTRSSRAAPPCEPVGFWHYKMVRIFA